MTGGVFAHVHIRVRDLEASRRFYVAIAEALELGPLSLPAKRTLKRQGRLSAALGR